MRINAGVSMVVAVLIAAATSSAQAATLQFAGTVTRVDFGLAGAFFVGQEYTLKFAYDPETADVNSSSTRGDFRGALGSSTVSLPGFTAQGDGGGIVLDDGTFGDGSDRYAMFLSSFESAINAPLVNGLVPYAVEVQLDDPTGNALHSDHLSGAIPTVAQYATRQFNLSFAESLIDAGARGVSRVYGTVTSISAVPEPSAAAMLLLGCIGVAGAAARYRKPTHA